MGVLVLVAAVVQVTVVNGMRALGAEPDLLLVTIVCAALVAGSLPGAIAGFAGGLAVDVMTLGTLGTTSIVQIQSPVAVIAITSAPAHTRARNRRFG